MPRALATVKVARGAEETLAHFALTINGPRQVGMTTPGVHAVSKRFSRAPNQGSVRFDGLYPRSDLYSEDKIDKDLEVFWPVARETSSKRTLSGGFSISAPQGPPRYAGFNATFWTPGFPRRCDCMTTALAVLAGIAGRLGSLGQSRTGKAVALTRDRNRACSAGGK